VCVQQMTQKKSDTFTAEVIASRRVTVDQSLAEVWGIEIGDIVEFKIISVHKKGD